jgi:hypothetical protein
MPEEGLRRQITDHLSRTDPLGRDYGEGFLSCLPSELERIAAACANPTPTPEEEIADSPAEALPGYMQKFVLQMAEIYSECLETEPTAESSGPLPSLYPGQRGVTDTAAGKVEGRTIPGLRRAICVCTAALPARFHPGYGTAFPGGRDRCGADTPSLPDSPGQWGHIRGACFGHLDHAPYPCRPDDTSRCCRDHAQHSCHHDGAPHHCRDHAPYSFRHDGASHRYRDHVPCPYRHGGVSPTVAHPVSPAAEPVVRTGHADKRVRCGPCSYPRGGVSPDQRGHAPCHRGGPHPTAANPDAPGPAPTAPMGCPDKRAHHAPCSYPHGEASPGYRDPAPYPCRSAGARPTVAHPGAPASDPPAPAGCPDKRAPHAPRPSRLLLPAGVLKGRLP